MIFEDELERRAFLKKAGLWVGGLLIGGSLAALAGCGEKEAVRPAVLPRASSPAAPPAPAGTGVDLAVAEKGAPGDLARRAVGALGGMSTFVQPGYTVLVKPNASFMDGPEAATSTHPDVVGAVVSMCREAGAARVIVLEHCLRGSPEACLGGNGIGAAARAAGAQVLAYDGGDSSGGVLAAVPGGTALKEVEVYPEVLEADLVITVPRAKHHGSAGLSLGMKNFIGVMTNMSSIHNHDLHRAIADLATLVKPGLSVIDASVILLDNGPGGPGPTRATETVVASGDVVAADSFACTLFGLTAADVPYVTYAGGSGLGRYELDGLNIEKV
jgi:uncharacterized protein (DUF362 family)